MLHKLEHDGLKADLASVTALLSSMSEEDDPIGYSQFLSRREKLEQALRALGDVAERSGKVALLFGGRPNFTYSIKTPNSWGARIARTLLYQSLLLKPLIVMRLGCSSPCARGAPR